MRTYTRNLAAGVETRIQTNFGRYYRVLEAISDFKVRLDDDALFEAFQGLGERVNGFETISLLSDIDQRVVVGVSDNQIDDTRINVEIAEQNRTLLGGSYFHGLVRTAPTGFPIIALDNPLGSGVEVTIDDFIIESNGSRVSIKTNVTGVTYTLNTSNLNNKLIGAPGSQLFWRSVDNPTPPLGNLMGVIPLATHVGAFPWNLKNRPFVLRQGEHIALYNNTSLLGLNVSASWEETPV